MSIAKQLPPDLVPYFTRLTKRAMNYKMVIKSDHDHWSPSWVVKNSKCFLVLLKEEYLVQKNKSIPSGTFFIWCCGVDDLDCAIRGLSKQEAINIFDKITDGISQEQLKQLGLIFGG